ncbi:MAG: NUDIX domain-containing protein [Bacilli bacterium]|nr:NUDIX domain-containing protein [Bacilli bacterium]
MKKEKSCGVIPFCSIGNENRVILIKQNNGVVGFPKGHVEINETEEETALRECKEETNLTPTLIKGFKKEISYYMPEYDAYKTVAFFIGVVKDISFKKQESEISDIVVLNIQDALDAISFKDTKSLLKKAYKFFAKMQKTCR